MKRTLARSTGAALAVVATVLLGGAAAAAPVAAPAAVAPANRVIMFADSVGLGARTALPAAFPPGWEVRVEGQPARFVEQIESQFVEPLLASNPEWFGDHVVIAAGYNYPYWDPARFDRSIDSLIDTLTAAGVRYVHWVTLREVKPEFVSPSAWVQVQPYYWYFPTVNDHLEAALERHPNLSLVDWAAVADQPGLTYDAIHLNTTGAALYSAIVRDSVTTVPGRLADGGTLGAAVPEAGSAGAAVVNLTVTAPRTAGYLTAAAGGCAAAGVSVHNYARAETAAHAAIVPIAGDGSFCIGTRAATHVIADVSGTFPAGHGFIGLTPRRWADTRQSGARLAAGATLELHLGQLDLPVAASDVAAIALTVTATEAVGPGFLRALPCGAHAHISNVNYSGSFPVPNLVIVAPADDGRVCITTLTDTHVIVDAFGVFAADAELSAVAARAFDSRTGAGPVAAGSVTAIDVAAHDPRPTLRGVVVNLTAVGARAPGYLTAYPCAAGRPDTSNLNVTGPHAVSNVAVVAPDSSGQVCVFSLSATDLIVDIQATIGAAFAGRTPQRVLDTRL
jgi:hypothetical protein